MIRKMQVMYSLEMNMRVNIFIKSYNKGRYQQNIYCVHYNWLKDTWIWREKCLRFDDVTYHVCYYL